MIIRPGSVPTRVPRALLLKLVALASRRYRLCLGAVFAERLWLVRAARHHHVGPRVKRIAAPLTSERSTGRRNHT